MTAEYYENFVIGNGEGEKASVYSLATYLSS